MSNETTTAVERGSSALSRHPLFGCGCCSDPEAYDLDHPDGCPREDGYTDHAYEGDCWKEQGRSDILATDVLKAALDVQEIAKAIDPRAFGPTLRGSNISRHLRAQQVALEKAKAVRAALLGGAS